MPPQVFVALSDRKMAVLIERAERRVALAVPALRTATATALVDAVERLGREHVCIVVDCDDEVFRLGYGAIAATAMLCEAGCFVRQSSGLRVGTLVTDDRAWVFAPTAEYVQPEVQSDETPNAVALRAEDVDRILAALMPTESDADEMGLFAPEPGGDDCPQAVEIGHEELSREVLTQTRHSLEQAPPVQFDIARQVRVFEPYLQYVELSLTGAAIQRHRVRIPEPIQKLGSTQDLEGRLRTTFDLIEKSSQLSSKQLEADLNEIRKNLTPSLGKDRGRVVLKSAKPLLVRRLGELRKKLHEHQAKVVAELKGHLQKSRDQVIEYYLPVALAKPPDALLGQSLNGKPDREAVRAWLESELDRVFPQAEQLVEKMSLEERYKDVTFETLNRPDFLESVKQAFPLVNWDQAYDEFKAAGERDR